MNSHVKCTTSRWLDSRLEQAHRGYSSPTRFRFQEQEPGITSPSTARPAVFMSSPRDKSKCRMRIRSQLSAPFRTPRGVHGIAIAPEFGRGFISAGLANAVIL